MWHLDSYDKIKRYGICINGCVDGFSRRITWMKAGCTSTAAAVGGYFLDAVKRFEGCPMQVRGDKGTENQLTSYLMEFLTGRESFICTHSVHNTRIESLWAILRRQCSQTLDGHFIGTGRKYYFDWNGN